MDQWIPVECSVYSIVNIVGAVEILGWLGR